MPRRKRRPAPEDAPPPLREWWRVDIKIDLHGMRAAQALHLLEQHVRTNHAANSPVVHVIHGHGTGALRSAVWEWLRKSPLVARFYAAGYGEGGDGVTIAELEYGQRRETRGRSSNSAPASAQKRHR